MFTDGSARKFSRKVTCAGWGFTAMKTYRNDAGAPIVSACGPVQTNEGEEFWVGATRATNNTADMQAVIEALYWLNSGIEGKHIPLSSKVMITVNSLCIKGLIDEKFVARENKAIAMLLCHLWKVERNRVRLTIRWVRGHWRCGEHDCWSACDIAGGNVVSRWEIGMNLFSARS